MQIHFLRHATFVLKLKGTQLLIDPMLGKVGSLDSIPKSPKKINPMVELPVSVDLSQVLGQINGVLISHTHSDHWDPDAKKLLSKDISILCQPGDESKIRDNGVFTNVTPLQDELSRNGISFHRTGGEHGRGGNIKKLGPVSGFVVRAEGEPTLYIAGDTVWCSKVDDAIRNFSPDVILVNAGAAFLNGGPITMTAEDVVKTCNARRSARVVAVHMEVMNHCHLTREGLRQTLIAEKLLDQVAIPADGDMLTF